MHSVSGSTQSRGVGRCLGPVCCMNGRGWGGPADTIGRGGSRLLGFEGEPQKNEPCPVIADADDVGSTCGLGSVAMAVDASGGDTCRVDGRVVHGIDRE